MPQTYPRSGFYPTRYSISHDPARREYSVALEGLTWREVAPAQTLAATNTK